MSIADVPTVWISVGLLWVAFFWFYRDYSIDKFRQEMFKVRDEMFDYADSSDAISFDHPAYTLLRSTMNGYIRFGHRLNLTTVLLFTLSLDEQDRDWLSENGLEARWRRAARELPDEVREQLNDFRRKIQALAAKQLVYGSPVLVATVVPAVLFTVLIRLQRRFVRRLYGSWQRRVGGQIDEAALAMGEVQASPEGRDPTAPSRV